MRIGTALLGAMLMLGAAPAGAAELFAGLLAHDVDTPLTKGGLESGADIQLGWRGDGIKSLSAIGSPSPYVFGSLATAGDTNFVAAGLSWKIGGRLFVRPGIGIAIHDRSSDGVGPDGFRTDFGSRILFAPELGVGYEMSPRLSIEASWVHLSHAKLFGPQNPGLDSLGARLTYRLR